MLEEHRRVSYQFPDERMGEQKKYKEIRERKLDPAMHEGCTVALQHFKFDYSVLVIERFKNNLNVSCTFPHQVTI